MRVILEGSLQHFSAGELLALAAAHGRSGTLNLESGEQRARIHLSGGRVVWAEAASGSPEEIVIGVAQWSGGTFTMVDATTLPEGITPVALEMQALVDEGQRRAAEEQQLRALYPNDDVIFRVVQRPETQEEISLTSSEFQILFQIGPGRSLADLKRSLGRTPAELYPVLQKLQRIGVLEAEGEIGDGTLLTPMPKPVETPERPAAPPRIPDTIRVAPVSAPETPVAPAVPREAPPAAKGHSSLIATLTSDSGAMHPLLEDSTLIGRDARNTIAIPSSSVSSRHARILRTTDGFLIEDLGSRNGTYVNSDSVTAPRLLADGDTVRFGREVLTFSLAKELERHETTRPEMIK
jgi:hypothetical protein